ncbi:trigger factor [Alpinimonas psychrophila]|uniref:Trigger factor n=1 Tax=Alpinimonas psychrophila TaxID=748908 RepID=A0A7W3JSY2_9MICO|nr:trigger factor [Alpinimonas psychrophila]
MKTTVETLSPTRAKITVTVTPEELKPALTHAYEHIAETITIPGFRKGKIPARILEQRVGKAAIMEHAVNEGLEGFYRQAVVENKIRPLGKPEADITTWPSFEDFTGDLVVTIEVDVRPVITLPDFDGLKVEVEPLSVSADEILEELDNLRSRFGTLISVDRPAKKGDFAQLDLVATIGGKEVDTASSISYELGSGELIEGIDEALDSLTAGETTTFESKLLGGDNEGEIAEITVTVTAVKERELPKADDDFAQIASEFDTIVELKANLKLEVERRKTGDLARVAREKLIEQLLTSIDIPVPAGLIETEVHNHLEGESRLEDDVHRAEVTEESTKTFKTQILLDTIAEAESVEVSQDELTQYIIQGSQQYGMEPSEFAEILTKNNQIPSIVAEVARNKAVAIVLGKSKVVDTKGKTVDMSAFAVVSTADAGATEGDAEKPAKKVAAKKAPAKAKADAAVDAADEAAAEKPAKKAAAKKPAVKKD